MTKLTTVLKYTAALTFVLSAGLVADGRAACDPKADACAPKKELDAWNFGLATGLNFTSGNSKTTVLTLLGNASRETKEDIIQLSADYAYGEDRVRKEQGLDKKNKDDGRAAASYKYLLTDRFFVGAGANFLYDDIANIDYRVTGVPVVGYFLLKDDDFKLSVETGPGYTFERVGDTERDYFSPKVGERFDWTISCTSKVYETVTALFDTSDSDNRIITAEAGAEAALWSNISLVFLIRDTNNNLPAPGKLKNDVATITALKVSF